MYCNKCGNDSSFRFNHTHKTVACRNSNCNNLVRNKNNFDFKGVDEINWFAHQMLQKLNIPRDQVKPDWDYLPIELLLTRLKAQMKLLESEHLRQVRLGITDNIAILKECCDVANYAMMIADNTCTSKHRAYMGE